MPSFKIIVGVLFGMLISAVIVLGVVSYRYNDQVVNTSFWVNHTYRVMLAADEISFLFRDHATKSQISGKLVEMRNLSKDNPEQVSLIDSLTGLTGRIHFEAQVTALLTRIKNKEIEMLRLREAENSQSIVLFNKAFGRLLAVIALLVFVAFFSIRYNFNKLLRIDGQLRVAQENTEKALTAEIELNKLKSNFVALASHEFRTPLTTVLSSAALLENYSFGEHQAKVQKHITRIKSSVNSLTSILDEFLSLSKIEEGRVIPNFERMDIKRHLQDCISNLQNFAKPGQTIHYSHTGEAKVETDPVFVANIINNLVTNSIKYSPENSPIYVTSNFNDGIRLSVSDGGIGIPEEDQKHLFERFYRGSNSGTVQGTGLGLHIMKHYVDMLNGTIKVESEVGKGTTVVVTLKTL